MRDAPTESELPPPDSRVTTRKHMADAVTYLIMVATDAGLNGVASKLVKVRASLLGRQPLESATVGNGAKRRSLDS